MLKLILLIHNTSVLLNKRNGYSRLGLLHKLIISLQCRKPINWCTLTCCIVIIEAVHHHHLLHPSHPTGITFGHSIGLRWRLFAIGGAYTFVDAGMRTPTNSIWEDDLSTLHPPYRIYTLIYAIVLIAIQMGEALSFNRRGCCRF